MVSKTEFDQLAKQAFESILKKDDQDSVEKALPIITLIVQSLKFGYSDTDLNDQLTLDGFDEQCRESILGRYKQLQPNLRHILQIYDRTHVSSRPRYLSVEWRIQVKVAAKHLRNQLTPQVILRFETLSSRGKREFFTMQCQIEDIYHIMDQLEGAIKSTNNPIHHTKVLRQIR